MIGDNVLGTCVILVNVHAPPPPPLAVNPNPVVAQITFSRVEMESPPSSVHGQRALPPKRHSAIEALLSPGKTAGIDPVTAPEATQAEGKDEAPTEPEGGESGAGAVPAVNLGGVLPEMLEAMAVEPAVNGGLEDVVLKGGETEAAHRGRGGAGVEEPLAEPEGVEVDEGEASTVSRAVGTMGYTLFVVSYRNHNAVTFSQDITNRHGNQK